MTTRPIRGHVRSTSKSSSAPHIDRNVVLRRKRKGRVVHPPGPDQLRLFVYIFFNFVQKLDLLRRSTYFGDIEMATISEAIAVAAIEPGMRDPKFREQFGSVGRVVGVGGQRGINALSVAAATGIPRETTRRKIKKLVELGAVIELRSGGYVMRPGFLQQKTIQKRLKQITVDTARFINDGLDQGLFKVSVK